jgi:kynurenine formamidase
MSDGPPIDRVHGDAPIRLPHWCGGARARVVDLSHPLTAATPIYPGDPEPRVFTATTIAEHGYNLSHVHLGTQTGTHLDAPFHFRDDGATIDRVPLAMTVGPAVVVPVTGKTAGETVTLADLEPYRDRLGPGRIALFCTGWYRHAGDAAFFDHPYLEAAVGEALLEAGVRTLAIDTLNADSTGGEQFPIHDMFAAAGGLIAENLAGTAGLDPRVEPLLLLLPLNLAGCDGAPVRAVALEPVP